MLRATVDSMLSAADMGAGDSAEVLETYRMFAHSRNWLRRMEEAIDLGLSAEAAVEKEQSQARARLGKRRRSLSARSAARSGRSVEPTFLRILTGQGRDTGAEMPENPILVARNIGPAELLEYGRRLKGVVLEEGSVPEVTRPLSRHSRCFRCRRHQRR